MTNMNSNFNLIKKLFIKYIIYINSNYIFILVILCITYYILVINNICNYYNLENFYVTLNHNSLYLVKTIHDKLVKAILEYIQS